MNAETGKSVKLQFVLDIDDCRSLLSLSRARSGSLFVAAENAARESMLWWSGLGIAALATVIWGKIERLLIPPADKIAFAVVCTYLALRTIEYSQWREKYAQKLLAQRGSETATLTEVSDAGWRQTTSNFDHKMHWNAFLHYVETEAHFILTLKNGSGLIAPKRALDVQQLADLTEILNAHLKRGAH